MCSYNEKKRKKYKNQILLLNKELTEERARLSDLESAYAEVNNLITLEDKALNYLNQCNFGGDKIVSSLKMSQKGYRDYVLYYEGYMKKCKKAILEIEDEIVAFTDLAENIPTNCGCCSECMPTLYIGPSDFPIVNLGKTNIRKEVKYD